MIYHVLPGDSLVAAFEKLNIEGEIIVCRECLIDGDLQAENLEIFWRVREDYLSGQYPKSENFYTENVQSEFEKLLNVDANDEINLWFEYELFCQANLWFCLSLLSDKNNAEAYRVAPFVRNENDLWLGFGGLNEDELEKCYEQRTEFSKADIEFGSWLWKIFATKDFEKFKSFDFEKVEKFPYLKDVVEAAKVIETRPRERISQIIEHGEKDFGKIFQRFGETEGVYGFGDLQVKEIYDSLLR